MAGHTANGTDGVGRERFLADASARGLHVEVVERPAAKSLEEAAGILGITPADIVKSLVVKHKDGTFLFALVPGDRQISWPKLRQLVGVNKLSLPPADIALEATGYERGTITPLGSTSPWPVYADATITGRRISMGAGAHGYSAFVDADALTSALGAVVADISDPM
ncbi:YbaK/prolyl-tRNA synthetase associated region [Pseudarthrobacter chlorophenolicus A6]|uniref:YbaK/prolyl-tRNA synthetase associated region n=1 Tax=Pseudarthrobacter chlorophenolicus (strain ATCC 700700 / DSM 12829 / CIP 107037 / JCM 12360 / KCTC 9906 / NCIMB 13794 / A6) TaxID=452863 RepID=B8HD19_PSECP|nr:YbaK/EbsC family protein [Pseudarthrobacter chlorophenolicus]ACL40665.1 YbaK/prolyl-tRNA synthetase associated region [Pseudarthrobacter chlorophenolicus A6]SDQ77328.1 Cys-tRNA(Pro) deacylase [Pseudarthrobacter chlorophenolicus]